MKRRRLLSGFGATAATGLLAGCTAELSGAAAGLTGRVGEPRALDIENATASAQTVRVRVTQEDGAVAFVDEPTVPPEADIEEIWTTNRIGRYEVTAQTPDGRQTSGTMFVCVGYHNAKLRIDPDGLLFGQAHGDPEAGACTLDTNR